jgi:pyruvate/2-oxoglutarate dehydrogenase complex dihydrolipoamide dehydrogenase (E3) component
VFAPQFDQSLESSTKADYVIIAIGQRSDFSWLADDDPLWNDSKRFIQADPLTLQSKVDWIFAGGDMATGPGSVVEATSPAVTWRRVPARWWRRSARGMKAQSR